MNNCDRQEQAEITTSFSVFADVANDKSLFDKNAQNEFSVEQYANFGQFTDPKEIFPG